jgi:RNAse (barnase) inhibitor barstar
MMTLPDALEQELRDVVTRYQAENQMPYIISFEHLAKEEGRQEERQEMTISVLEARFGELDDELSTVVEAMMKLSPPKLMPLLLTLSREELLHHFS